VPVTPGYGDDTNGYDEGAVPYAPAAMTPIPNQNEVPDNGTYEYDGGPAEPVPLPKVRPGPTSAPAAYGAVPLRQVSRPQTQAPRFAYPAYGEPARPSTNTPERAYLTGNPSAAR
jgi:hypothetical protein